MATQDLPRVFSRTASVLTPVASCADVENPAPYKGFRDFKPLPSGDASIVMGDPASPSSAPSTHTSTPSTDSSSRKRGRPPKSKPKTLTAIASSRLFKLKLRKPGRPKKPSWMLQWRDLSDKTKLERHVEAILATGNARACTFLLSDEKLTKVMGKPDEFKLDSVFPAFLDALEGRLGRKPLAVFAAHYNAAGRWHIHAIMDLGLDDLPTALEASQEVFGQEPKLARGKRQFDFRQAYSSGWGRYMLREAPGKSVKTTAETTRAAKAHHKLQRLE